MPQTCHFVRIYFQHANDFYIYRLNRSNPCNRMHFPEFYAHCAMIHILCIRCYSATFYPNHIYSPWYSCCSSIFEYPIFKWQRIFTKDIMNHVCLTFLYWTFILLRVSPLHALFRLNKIFHFLQGNTENTFIRWAQKQTEYGIDKFFFEVKKIR